MSLILPPHTAERVRKDGTLSGMVIRIEERHSGSQDSFIAGPGVMSPPLEHAGMHTHAFMNRVRKSSSLLIGNSSSLNGPDTEYEVDLRNFTLYRGNEIRLAIPLRQPFTDYDQLTRHISGHLIMR